MKCLLEAPHSSGSQNTKKKGRSKKAVVQDIRLVGRLVVSKSSVNPGSILVDQQQVDLAHALGFSLYLHVL